MGIEVRGLGHVYSPGTENEVAALSGVSLGIRAGEFVGVIGPTGSGKSTFAQCLNGLIRPTEGSIQVDGQEITTGQARRDLRWLRRKVGMVFQFPEHQLFDETVLADVSFGPRNLGLAPAEATVRAEQALAAVGLDEPGIAARSPFALSGGQMRRVAIAGVLAMSPQVLVLDEPAAGLDPQGRSEILGQVKRLHAERGITVILISHNMEEVARLAERLLVFAGGRLVMDGSPAEVFSRGGELRQLGLDVPAGAQALEALRQLGWDLPASAGGVDEAAALIAAAWHRRRRAAATATAGSAEASGDAGRTGR
jgi:energy-coupling factor transport system ATP-binding protein